MRSLKRLTFTPVLSTSIYDANDTLFATILAGELPNAGARCFLRSVVVHDADDEGPQMTLYFLRSNVAFGTVNAAPSITDANSLFVTGSLAVAAADFADLGGAKVAIKQDLMIPLETADGTAEVYVAATTTGTPTYTAATDVVIDLFVEGI